MVSPRITIFSLVAVTTTSFSVTSFFMRILCISISPNESPVCLYFVYLKSTFL